MCLASAPRWWTTSVLAFAIQLVATRCQAERWSVPNSVVVGELMNSFSCTDWAEHLTGQVHDMWFSVDDLRIDKQRHEIVIPLRDKPRSTPRVNLVIPNARAIRITDTERIGVYDINYVKVMLSDHVLSIRGNIPIRVDIEADDPCAAHVVQAVGDAPRNGGEK